jgi:hypothetical protein
LDAVEKARRRAASARQAAAMTMKETEEGEKKEDYRRAGWTQAVED